MSKRLPGLAQVWRRLSTLEKLFVALLLLASASQALERLSGSESPLEGLLNSLLLVVGVVLGIRYLVRLIRRTVWRLRNRLILSYMFIGVVPIALILTMLGIGMYILMGQVATYLITREINRRNETLRDFAYSVAWTVAGGLSSDNAQSAAEKFLGPIRWRLPRLQTLLRVDGRISAVRADSGASDFPTWSRNGFWGLIGSGREYAIAAHVQVHRAGRDVEVFAYEPADAALLSDLLPQLAAISFFELQKMQGDNSPSSGGDRDLPQRAERGQAVRFARPAEADPSSRSRFALPAAKSWWDIEVRWGTPVSVRRWESENAEDSDVLVRVESRPSLIIGQLFSTLGPSLAGSLRFLLYLIGGLFLLVEIASLVFGVGLTRSITRSVADLYEGTLKINAGDFSKRITIRSKDQLSELAASFNRMTASIERLILESKEKERLESELEIAREVQTQLFPKAIPHLESLEVFGLCQPARMVSGDYYDFIQLNSNWTALAIGDIAGKGISAALLMASIQSSVRAQLGSAQSLDEVAFAAAKPPPTAELARLLNQQLYESTSPEKFATFFLALYHEPTSRLFYTNAGHLPPLLLRDTQTQRLEVNGMVLGAFPDQAYEYGCLELRSGDLLAAYTDGITEPENEYGEEFGERRLLDVLVQNARKPLNQVVAQVTASVQEWSSASEQPDDMTLLLMRRA